MTLYAYFVLYIGQTKVDNFCENQFFQVQSDVVIELCEENVWKNSFPDAYDYE